MAQVALKNIGKAYGAAEVIRNVNLELDDGSLTVFVGPSGCGKSTLLRMIAGLEPITRGEVVIDGATVNMATPTERGIAMVFQNYALYPHMTVRQNIGFPLKMAGLDKDDVDRRVDAAARSLQIEPLLDRKPSALSGGQRQRVAIGRAIVREPKVFLFDEPLSNLDAELRVQMRLEISKLHKQLASTMIYVTHDQVEAMTLADKIVVLRAGKIEQVGAPVELYQNPDNVFVAAFIGSPRMNLLKGRIGKLETGTCCVVLEGFDNASVQFGLAETSLRENDQVFVGIRPEHFDSQGNVTVDIEVDAVENLGGTSYAYGRGGSDELITVELKGKHGVRSGDRYTARFAQTSALLFDMTSGLRLR